jgi:peptidoglycan/xylan/chitin deacetylase (PgdA/CDA1 family)
VIDHLAAWSGIDVAYARPSHRTMSESEVRGLASDDLFDIGGHTVTHPRLAGLPADVQTRELQSSRTRLERLLARDVDLLAYPYGKSEDFDETTIECAGAVGYRAAFTNVAGALDGNTDPFRIARVFVRDADVLRLDDGILEVAS